MEYELVPIEDIIPDPMNPRKISEAQFSKIKKGIKEFGLLLPIVVNKNNNEIVSGHQRYKAYVTLNYKEIPVVWTDKNSEDQKIANISLNEVNVGEWDTNKLQSMVNEFIGLGLDVNSLGMNNQEFKNLNIDTSGDIFGDLPDSVSLGVKPEGKTPSIIFKFYSTDRDREYRMEIQEDEFEELKTLFKEYSEKEGSEKGFISNLLKSKGNNLEEFFCANELIEETIGKG